MCSSDLYMVNSIIGTIIIVSWDGTVAEWSRCETLYFRACGKLSQQHKGSGIEYRSELEKENKSVPCPPSRKWVPAMGK